MTIEFIVPENEEKRYTKWLTEHDKVCTQKDFSAIGGRLTWSFTQTGLGCIRVVRCACGKELDLTDYENW